MDLNQFEAVTDTVEKYVVAAHEWSKTHQQLLTLTMGGVILCYNGRLGCSILLFNCVKGVGMPLLQKSFSELYDSYRSVKRTLKEEGPALQKALTEMKSLSTEVKDLEVAVKELQSMAQPDAEKIKHNMEKIKSAIGKLSDASSRGMELGRRVNSKFDYASLKKCLTDLYVVCLSALASANSTTVANLSIGVSLGSSITHNLQGLVEKYKDSITAQAKKVDQQLELNDKNIAASAAAAALDPEKLPQQLHVLAAIIGNTIGLSVSMYLTRPARMFAAVTLGTEIVIHALEGLIDPYLAKQGLPTVKANAVALTSVICGLGVAYNVYLMVPGSNAGVIGELVLAPLLLVESGACLIVATANQ